MQRKAKLGTAGDYLYVRETAAAIQCYVDSIKVRWWQYEYDADGNCANWTEMPKRLKFTPEIGRCCPSGAFKEIASIWFNITGVRAERVQGISLEDIYKEGVPETDHRGVGHMRDKWKELINACYPGSWERNDWVFVYELERCEKPLIKE
jgi:hypothetical protein